LSQFWGHSRAALLSDPVYRFKLSQQAASYLKRLDRDLKKRIEERLLEALKDPISSVRTSYQPGR
jgi:hypothetical protein